MSIARKILPPFVGLVLGALCALLSVAVAGGGHGWNSALPFGLCALLLYPSAFVGAQTPDTRRELNSALLVAAVALDAWLAVRSLQEGLHYVVPVWPFALAWLALWFGWQGLALRSWIRAKK
ncbi:hypothetical protein FCE95_16185 [Luteimonas gilva]|uniref:Uncharacterized protein n=1 Tax=Luteimonas gilva TaxID=2572684 RepID=A0A4U5JM97_9GAMM|nr:hypothetical protein [Luteimonas gilva]TKR29661.1 hypothetical protein FCE95_16185 [Luteimonas gilva]